MRTRLSLVAALLFAAGCVTTPEVKPDTDALPDGGVPAETAEIPYEPKPKTEVEVAQPDGQKAPKTATTETAAPEPTKSNFSPATQSRFKDGVSALARNDTAAA